ncbi:MAG: hypothetical protein K2O65_06275 [Lachnospiraceae bacterium]|nr:hypothetical protein [Lachnospiraceae bacterium]
MNITGVGSISSYYYNVETNKLVSKSSEDDAFVKWYNGEITEEELPDEFNGFDMCKKQDIAAALGLMRSGTPLGGDILMPTVDGNLCEISFNIVKADMTKVSVNGKEVLTSYTALGYIPDEVKTFKKGLEFLKHINTGVDGKINVIKNDRAIPTSTYYKALKRYEEQLYLPLDIFIGKREITKQK